MDIRRATPGDFAVLRAIETDAALMFHEQATGIPVSEGDCTDADFQRGLDEGTVLVAETTPGAPLGFLMVWRIDHTAHLRELDVLRANQGQGVGRSLIAAAERWAAESGFTETTLTTFRDIPWNGLFYARLGYAPFTPGTDHPTIAAMLEAEAHHFPGHPRIAMRKQVS